jgi:L-lactate dehydrogenase complex protein LldG
MSAAKEAILGRIRDARPGTAGSAGAGGETVGPPVPGDPRLFAARVADYGAGVHFVGSSGEIAVTVQKILEACGAGRIGAPPGLPPQWRPAEVIIDDPPRSYAELATLDGVLTGAALGIAETGTLILAAGAAEGRRALSLLPDLHICVLDVGTIVADVGDAFAAIAAPTAPLTFVSGPSATSDIELERVEGVHGPRRLEVVLVGDRRD